jgi:hypothetical protein
MTGIAATVESKEMFGVGHNKTSINDRGTTATAPRPTDVT